jgi:hypothetical protein
MRFLFLRWLNHNRLKLVLEYDHSAVAELDGFGSRAGGSGVRRESARESVNVVRAASLNKRPLDLRDLPGKTARHLARRVLNAIGLKAWDGT